jgi:uncharacterized protein YdaU (DUF1376 family)
MAAKWQLWMPLYIDRWKGSAHVQAMRATARAGYLYLLTAAWQTEDCSLPSDDDELAILSGLPDDEWTEHKDKIRRQFIVSADGRITNAVLKAEWTKAKQIFESRQSNALRTHSKRKAGDEHKQSICSVGDEQTQSIRKALCNADTGTSTGTVTSTEKPENTLALTAVAVVKVPMSADEVERVYAAYPRHVGRAKALEAIRKAVTRLRTGKDVPAMGCTSALVYLRKAVERYARSPAGNAGKYTPHAATWFNQARYFDDEREWQLGTNTQHATGNGTGGIASRALAARKQARTAIANSGPADGAWNSATASARRGRVDDVLEGA